ncbi:DNA polymerase III subunit beta [Chroococcidiopsis sp. CCMEE 29]|uniref:DNA polymerase III subunit beta n=1 Tax=Chroococcidiopsis sp. CCMEE 29 TaxID=155894 RepID=UPI002021381C|nr:DNA polymerase III subunit beta [Chroococcidiopsis sp. CCMEE 29]
MKLVCNQSDLSTHLSLVSRAVPSRPTHPVLANVLLQADVSTQRVSLTAFDLSLGIRTSFPAEIETGGEITLPAKLLNDIVSRLPEGAIALEDEAEETLRATITSASGRYQVRGMGVEEFPELPVLEKSEAVNLSAEALIEGLKGSLFATSADETKQVLTGLHLTVQQDTLEFAATDGHRLAVVQTANESLESEELSQLEVTVPAKALRELERMLGIRQSTEAVTLNFDQGQIIFEWADQRLTSRTLEGQYPAYRQLIPHRFERQISLERRHLLNALERIAVLADQKNNIVKFSIDSVNQEVALSVDAQDVGSGRELMPAQASGESLEIAFNIKYLMDGLKALQSSEIQIQMNTATSPVILTPLGSLKMTYLIMPVQIRN